MLLLFNKILYLYFRYKILQQNVSACIEIMVLKEMCNKTISLL